MAALTYRWDQGERIESLTETAGTDLSTTANTDAIAVSTTALEAAMAVLVADGASPTQAHVNTANSALTTLLALIVTAKASALAAVPSDTVEVHIKTGQRASDVIQGLDAIKARVATSKVLAP